MVRTIAGTSRLTLFTDDAMSNSAAYVMQDSSMDNCIPCGLAAIFDPELAPVNGQISVVRVDGNPSRTSLIF